MCENSVCIRHEVVEKVIVLNLLEARSSMDNSMDDELGDSDRGTGLSEQSDVQ